MITNLSQFMAFAAVARQLSFAGAARELGLAPSSVAKSVARLESRMNVRLFVRTTRSVQLTADGEELFQRCSDVLAQVAALEESTDARSTEPTGVLRISAPIGYGGKVLVPAIGRLLERHPMLRADLRLTDERVDLAKDGLDAALRFGKLPDSGLIAREVDRQPLLLCASPRYLARHPAPQHPTDIEGHDVIAFRMPGSGRDRPLEFRVSGAPTAAKFTPRLWLSHGESLVDAMLADCGLAQVPHFMVEDALASGRLVELLPALRPDPLDVNLVTSGGRILLPRVRVLLDELRERTAHAAFSSLM
jgi:LysR family transcriptional regulator for bpeEF and oprC